MSLTEAKVTASDGQIEKISDEVQRILREAVDPRRVKDVLLPFKVFIGYGGDCKWEAVRDYIANEHEIVAFESDDRAGRATLEVVENMISESPVAAIVITGVDRVVDDRLLARQNVVH